MITIQHQWGADYLAFNEPIHLHPTTIFSPQGVTLAPGQRVSKMGSKRRSSFELLPGKFMTYEGLLWMGDTCYAIFHCPDHDDPQLTLFTNTTQYRYAFTCVFVKGQVNCFLVGPGGTKGVYDIVLDKVW